ncbi:hypothetical protein [Winogradskyella luteola]|uniref:Uncharacterized protein n=1 Tax=Winogradskyella luteola TaxID=2828330 RepID=A0A9X1JNA3_9FLAO|nr:hypothetical protein [Winogradskyella luteola]MBV7269186.1 hypothetical protein [Winogradskyella luteola]
MKLTKAEIKFIDNYLIKNGVKYWDVRLELLDHTVSAVEDKINNEGVSFNEALLEIHHGFGNRIHNGYTYHLDFEKALYIDNKGLKKLTLKAQKNMAKQHRKRFWKTYPKFLMSLRFLLEFSIIIGIVFVVHRFNPKTALIIALIACFLPEIFKIFFGVFDRSNRKSLKMQMAVNISSLYMALSYLLMGVFNSYYDSVPQKPYVYLTVFFVCLFPFVRHALNTYKQIFIENREEYRLVNA